MVKKQVEVVAEMIRNAYIANLEAKAKEQCRGDSRLHRKGVGRLYPPICRREFQGHLCRT